MVKVTLVGDRLRFDVRGLDRLLGLKTHIEVAAQDIASVGRETDFPRLWSGLRWPGAELPGVFRVGSYYHHGSWTYWDVHWKNRDRAITVELEHNRYRRLIIEVEDAEAAIATITSARTAVA